MKNTSLLIRRSWLLLVGLLNWFYVQAQDIPLPSQAQLRWQQYDGITVDIDTVTLAGACGVPVDFPNDEPAR